MRDTRFAPVSWGSVSSAIVLLATAVAAIALWPGLARAGWETRTIAGSPVHVYTPASGGVIGAGRGLLIVLHGCVQTHDVLRDRGGLEPAAEDYGLVVAVPRAPGGGVIAGCWDYYGTNHARSGRHDGFLLELAELLSEDSALGIDRDQRYISGLSSGGGQAAVMGCLAPDVFAGVGINAGPAVGTSSSEASVVASDAARAAAACGALAGANRVSLETQLASIVAGTGDHIVAQAYNRVHAEALASLYAGSAGALVEGEYPIGGLRGHEPRGTGRVWSDLDGPRITLMMLEGMGHAFPAGTGPGQEISFVAARGVSWPYQLAQHFTENNRRVAGAAARDAGAPSPRDAGASAGGRDAGVNVPLGDAGTDDGLSGAGEGTGGCSAVEQPRASIAGMVGGPSVGREAAVNGLSGDLARWLVILVLMLAVRVRRQRAQSSRAWWSPPAEVSASRAVDPTTARR